MVRALVYGTLAWSLWWAGFAWLLMASGACRC